MSIDEPNDFQHLRPRLDEIRRLHAEVQSRFAELQAKRTKFFKTRSALDKNELDRVEAEVGKMWDRSKVLLEEIRRELPKEVLSELDAQDLLARDWESKLARNALTESRVAVTEFFERHLPTALDEVIGLIPKDWLETDNSAEVRLNRLFDGAGCLSLVKGLRPESEFNPVHRLRQAIIVTRDYVNKEANYDHFAGATVVPQIVQLGSKLESLRRMGGDVEERLKSLWQKPSHSCDSTFYELLVAAGCVEYGRNVEFLPETNEKSPDIKCHDPYPMVIECKRKNALSKYEIAEETKMRVLFSKLEVAAQKLGLCGRFDLTLKSEVTKIPIDEVVSRLVSQRLAAHPEHTLDYPWGSVAFHELSRRIDLSYETRTYSPFMLKTVFGWNTDLPEWDGIFCHVASAGQSSLDRVTNPVALVWTNTSAVAIKKRSWGPVDLLGKAMDQIPHGEFGIIYIAYHEGSRAEIADRRVEQSLDRIKDWEHSSNIRVPISFLNRLYPRALDEGNPDLIESTIRLCSGVYGEPALFEQFPNSVFTRT